MPLRWYPPEYFKNNYYSFKGDVWSFGIVLWEMQTFGELMDKVAQTLDTGCNNGGTHMARLTVVKVFKLKLHYTFQKTEGEDL